MIPHLPDDMAYWFGTQTPSGKIVAKKRRTFKAPKSATDSRPTRVYSVVYPDGKVKSWLHAGPWEKLRAQVKAEKWPDISTAQRPRFFYAELEWWQVFDATEVDDG